MIVLFLKLQKLERQPIVILIRFKIIVFVYLFIKRKWDRVSQKRKDSLIGSTKRRKGVNDH